MNGSEGLSRSINRLLTAIFAVCAACVQARTLVREWQPQELALNAEGGWNARLNWPAQTGSLITLRLANTTAGASVIRFASDTRSGWHPTTFPLRSGTHTYNIDLSADTTWSGLRCRVHSVFT